MSEALWKPFRVGRFLFTRTGVSVVAGESPPEWEDLDAAVMFAENARIASGWWLADLLRYAKSRPDWADRLSQIEALTGLSEKTLINVKAIGAIPPARRREDLEFSHHGEVVKLPPGEQTDWLEKAADGHWTQRELRHAIRASRRRKVLEGQAKLEGRYRVIYADPPWLYRDAGATADGSLGKAERHYLGMTIEQICAMPVPAHSMPNAMLALWVTTPIKGQTPGPRDVMESWGFTYKTEIVWNKVLGNPGHYSHVIHEALWIGTRGDGQPDNTEDLPLSVQTVRRTPDLLHSEKPAIFRELIEKHWTRGPYLELFARQQTPGWVAFGDDERLWA